jgi:hypothetical protein
MAVPRRFLCGGAAKTVHVRGLAFSMQRRVLAREIRARRA